MPQRDRRGPYGEGPMTGRRLDTAVVFPPRQDIPQSQGREMVLVKGMVEDNECTLIRA
jgi:hypothetical protein